MLTPDKLITYWGRELLSVLTNGERIQGRLTICLDSWFRYPTGHYVRTLGAIGDREAETEALLLQHNITYHPFSSAVLACLPKEDWTAESDPDFGSKHRRDLRHLEVCSVDPPGCTDIDDALHVRQLENGNWEFGVRIQIVEASSFLNHPRHCRCILFCATRHRNGFRGNSSSKHSLSRGQKNRYASQTSQ